MMFSRALVQPGTRSVKRSARMSEIEIQAQTSDLKSFLGARIADNEDSDYVIENREITTEENHASDH